jgi:hypothetical protein
MTYRVEIQLGCSTQECAEVLMAGVSKALNGEMRMLPGTGVHLVASTLRKVERNHLDLERGICSCGNRFDGDNFCMPSACQMEV